jgi:hypothetical protein
MGSTLVEDTNELARITGAFDKSPSKVRGGIVFAGAHWPPRAKNSLKYFDVETAIREARAMIAQGYMAACAALRGEATAAAKMARWFGARPGAAPDWWVGAKCILGAVEDFVLRPVHVYYRGDNSLIGKPTDYPGEAGNLDAQDVSGYAESAVNVQNSIIGLCKLFFAKQAGTGQAKVKVRGIDSVGGCLVHELTHNICGTEDHETFDDSDDCYGTADCLQLATNKPSRAWYNADNLEYFCEEVYYKL